MPKIIKRQLKRIPKSRQINQPCKTKTSRIPNKYKLLKHGDRKVYFKIDNYAFNSLKKFILRL